MTPLREIVLDTETTGFDPKEGHRIVEIGCVELVNHLQTGARFHRYINPERAMPPEAFAVHGLSDDFLAAYPVFADHAADFLDFIQDSPLVIHNAEFDMRFLNAELFPLSLPPLPMTRAVDTVQLARKRFPGSPASLDALCRRFAIDNSNRSLHGALLDAQLLAEVYLELLGGRQQTLGDLMLSDPARAAANLGATPRPRREARVFPEIAAERQAHEALLDQIKSPIWRA